MGKLLQVCDYADAINLYEEFVFGSVECKNKEELVDALLLVLNEEDALKFDYTDKRRLLHGIINTLQPETLKYKSIAKLDLLLQLELQEKTITDAEILYSTKGEG